MAKDLIIGAASNYTYDHVKYWINSIKKSGFDGDIVLVCTNMRNDELTKVAEKGVNIMVYGRPDANGNFVNDSKTAPHLERFFYLWNFLYQCEPYRYVVTTDVRDVVFQSDPIKHIEKLNLEANGENFIAASEGMYYIDEPWGNGNLEIAFGPFFRDRWNKNEIYNVGILAGTHAGVRDMLLMIYQMGINRPFDVVDQAVYNFMLGVPSIANSVLKTKNEGTWAVNLGTTLPAVMSGAGDLGYNCVRDPEKLKLYNEKYLCKQPIIDGDLVQNYAGKEICVVHQYDRVNGLKEKIMEKFDG